jgi:hypothetical protein
MWLSRHKTLATAAATFVLAFLLLFVAVFPMYRSASSLLKKIDTKSKELDTLTEKVAVLSQLDPTVLSDRVKVLDSALPPKKDILLYLNSIEGLSKELGLTFGGLSLSPGDITEATGSAATAPVTNKKKPVVKTAAGLGSLDTEIKMRGGKEAVYTFLRTIEDVLPLMQIQDIKVSVLTGDQYSLALTLGMLWAEPVTANVKGPVTLFGAEEDKYFTQLAGYRVFEPVTLLENTESSSKQDLFAPFTLPVAPAVNIIETPVVTTPETAETEPETVTE